jgi:PAS domain S-box-containing protein
MSGRAPSLPYIQYVTAAVESIKDAVMLIGVEDNAYRLMMANKAFHDTSGFTADTVGKEVSELLDTKAYDFTSKHFQKVVETGAPVEYTQWFQVPLGRRAYEVRMVPITNAVDEVVQILVIARDITESARLKEEVQALRAASYLKP